ncbi:uncharacterized protein LOC133888710 [Phragmites australis]|uniref:uncharacterized protein LOC133888710 n=1 Tax=Phragmites australis TaxID=29695 RepID=UPI002D78C90C|nr:uncharacterized protein LOC133888710 [Phragmites australis]
MIIQIDSLLHAVPARNHEISPMTPSPRNPGFPGYRLDGAPGHNVADALPSTATTPMEVVSVSTMTGGSPCLKEPRSRGDAPSMGSESPGPKETGNADRASRGKRGREIHNGGDRGGHRVAISFLPLKKRATKHSSGGSSSHSGDSSLSPKKRRIDDYAGVESEDAGGCGTPVPRHRGPPLATPGATAASLEPAVEGDALSKVEEMRLKKGKWIATAETSSVAPQPQVTKLMHDGIRSGALFNERLLHHAPSNTHAEEAVAAATTTTTGKKQSNNTDAFRSGTPRGGESCDSAVFGEALHRRLASLGATRPSFVYRKRLKKSDVCPNQNRLLVSCKGDVEGCPLTRCFSPAEMRRVEDKLVGLTVTAFDRRGEAHALNCKFLGSNCGYRFISKWKKFLARNGLELDGEGGWTRNVDVELWAFRSRALPRQPRLNKNGMITDKEEADHFHPDGSFGLLLLHDECRRRRVESEEDRGKGKGALLLPAARKKVVKLGKRNASASAAPASRKKDMKLDERDASSLAAAAPAVREKDVNLDKRDVSAAAAASAAPPVAQGEGAAGATMSKAEMVAAYGEAMSRAVIGMLSLRGSMLGSGAGERIKRRGHGA